MSVVEVEQMCDQNLMLKSLLCWRWLVSTYFQNVQSVQCSVIGPRDKKCWCTIGQKCWKPIYLHPINYKLYSEGSLRIHRLVNLS